MVHELHDACFSEATGDKLKMIASAHALFSMLANTTNRLQWSSVIDQESASKKGINIQESNRTTLKNVSKQFTFESTQHSSTATATSTMPVDASTSIITTTSSTLTTITTTPSSKPISSGKEHHDEDKSKFDASGQTRTTTKTNEIGKSDYRKIPKSNWNNSTTTELIPTALAATFSINTLLSEASNSATTAAAPRTTITKNESHEIAVQENVRNEVTQTMPQGKNVKSHSCML